MDRHVRADQRSGYVIGATLIEVDGEHQLGGGEAGGVEGDTADREHPVRTPGVPEQGHHSQPEPVGEAVE